MADKKLIDKIKSNFKKDDKKKKPKKKKSTEVKSTYKRTDSEFKQDADEDNKYYKNNKWYSKDYPNYQRTMAAGNDSMENQKAIKREIGGKKHSNPKYKADPAQKAINNLSTKATEKQWGGSEASTSATKTKTDRKGRTKSKTYSTTTTTPGKYQGRETTKNTKSKTNKKGETKTKNVSKEKVDKKLKRAQPQTEAEWRRYEAKQKKKKS